MQDFSYVIRNFFTHKDFLVPAEQLPGTLYTPLHFAFELVLLAVIIGGAVRATQDRRFLRRSFITLWIVAVIWEVLIIAWDNLAGRPAPFDYTNSLSLYPCSIFLYTMPFAIWGKGIWKRAAYGYLCTLGMLGAAVNFIYPISRLTDYSCISFPGFHTFFFHGSMLYVFLALNFSGLHSYTEAEHGWELLLPSAASMLVSIPANLLNYSALDTDYMYFKGRFFVLSRLFGDTPEPLITASLYGLYLLIPALFYLPGYLLNRRQTQGWEQEFERPDCGACRSVEV